MEALSERCKLNCSYFPTCRPNLIISIQNISKLENQVRKLEEEAKDNKDQIKALKNKIEDFENLERSFNKLKEELDGLQTIFFKGRMAIVDLSYSIVDGYYVFDGIKISGPEIAPLIRSCNTAQLFAKCMHLVFTKEELEIKKSERAGEFEVQRIKMQSIAKFCVKAVNNYIMTSKDSSIMGKCIQQSELQEELKKLSEKFNRIKGDSRKKRKLNDDPNSISSSNALLPIECPSISNVGVGSVEFDNNQPLFEELDDREEIDEQEENAEDETTFDLSRLTD